MSCFLCCQIGLVFVLHPLRVSSDASNLLRNLGLVGLGLLSLLLLELRQWRRKAIGTTEGGIPSCLAGDASRSNALKPSCRPRVAARPASYAGDGSAIGSAKRNFLLRSTRIVRSAVMGEPRGLGRIGVGVCCKSQWPLMESRCARARSAPGVGKRTAERLTLEWRSRLQERWSQLGGQVALTVITSGGPQQTLRTELESTLSALGYGPEELQQAMAHCSREVEESAPLEEWLRQCLAWLSREAA